MHYRRIVRSKIVEGEGKLCLEKYYIFVRNNQNNRNECQVAQSETYKKKFSTKFNEKKFCIKKY